MKDISVKAFIKRR